MPVSLLLICSRNLLRNHNRIDTFKQMVNICLITSIRQMFTQASHQAFFEELYEHKAYNLLTSQFKPATTIAVDLKEMEKSFHCIIIIVLSYILFCYTQCIHDIYITYYITYYTICYFITSRHSFICFFSFFFWWWKR